MDATRWLARGAAVIGYGPAAPAGRALLLLTTAVTAAVAATLVLGPVPTSEPVSEPERNSDAQAEAEFRHRHLSHSPPRRLIISTLDIDAAVVRLLDPIGTRPQVPGRASRAGWYADHTSPGEPGSAVLVGTADAGDRSTPAVFADLHRLKAGDRIQVVRADGWTVVFRVLTVTSEGAVDGPESSGSRPRLRLVAVAPGRQGADPVLVVTAALVGKWTTDHQSGGGQTDERQWNTPQARQRQAQRSTVRSFAGWAGGRAAAPVG